MTSPKSLTDTQLRDKLRELSNAQRLLRAEVRRRKPKKAKPKVTRTITAEERAREREWNEWRPDMCWACWRTADDKPTWWHGPWLIERAHFVHSGTGNRIEDVRLCCALCSGCHKTYDGAKFPNWELPRLTQGNMIHLLALCWPAKFDMPFIKANNIGAVEAATPLPRAFIEARERA